MDLRITEAAALSLAEELWGKIRETGYNAQSKNDFYDFALYLFNKYDEGHFLSSRSNYENSQLLRVSVQKIKNVKENIFLKYYDDGEKAEVPLRFLDCVAGGALQPEADGARYTFVLDDPRTRRYLEYVLKRDHGTSFDYRINTEKVTLDIRVFYQLCSAVVTDLCEKTGADEEGLRRSLASRKQSAENRMLAEALINGGMEAAESVTKLPVKAVAGMAAALAGYFKSLLKH